MAKLRRPVRTSDGLTLTERVKGQVRRALRRNSGKRGVERTIELADGQVLVCRVVDDEILVRPTESRLSRH